MGSNPAGYAQSPDLHGQAQDSAGHEDRVFFWGQYGGLWLGSEEPIRLWAGENPHSLLLRGLSVKGLGFGLKYAILFMEGHQTHGRLP